MDQARLIGQSGNFMLISDMLFISCGIIVLLFCALLLYGIAKQMIHDKEIQEIQKIINNIEGLERLKRINDIS